jgi:hypothetical protein
MEAVWHSRLKVGLLWRIRIKHTFHIRIIDTRASVPWRVAAKLSVIGEFRAVT